MEYSVLKPFRSEIYLSLRGQDSDLAFDNNSRTWSRLNAASQDFRKENGDVQYCYELEWNF